MNRDEVIIYILKNYHPYDEFSHQTYIGNDKEGFISKDG